MYISLAPGLHLTLLLISIYNCLWHSATDETMPSYYSLAFELFTLHVCHSPILFPFDICVLCVSTSRRRRTHWFCSAFRLSSFHELPLWLFSPPNVHWLYYNFFFVLASVSLPLKIFPVVACLHIVLFPKIHVRTAFYLHPSRNRPCPNTHLHHFVCHYSSLTSSSFLPFFRLLVPCTLYGADFTVAYVQRFINTRLSDR